LASELPLRPRSVVLVPVLVWSLIGLLVAPLVCTGNALSREDDPAARQIQVASVTELGREEPDARTLLPLT